MKHAPGFEKAVDAVRPVIREMTIDEWSKQDQHSRPMLIDVREDREWLESHLPDATHIGRGVIERDIEAVVPNKQQPLVLYCGGGYRSALAAESLQRMGYTDVRSLAGGIREWREKKLPETRTPKNGELAFDHIAVQTKTTTEAVKFFTSFVPNSKLIYQDDTWAFVEVNGTRVAFVTNEQHPGHLAWRVSDEDLERLATQHGKTIRAHRDRTKSFYLPGPDGLWLELISYPVEAKS
jgi:rhodanese-related sulfurtransferase